ncbi:hypothetical protein [Methanimicrococcus blatticola]|uniref:hypothetical protein n=1 Tax=Methanimicrococcus blatticola TaxID=91560 RepID=UPI00106087E3|nr:hypothetical protein [Methanimicrococcus blatticola]MBZ3935094.1 hypothetical protein [Methanimicrococcus blatticola]MCC2508809.1 hypothetical protein [Methanimicrococcus blatticola]
MTRAMTRKINTDKEIGYGYPIKPPCLTMPDSFEGKVSKKHKMLFLIHKKALETPVFHKTFLTLSTFISLFSFSAFVSFFGTLFFFDLFSFFTRLFPTCCLTLEEMTYHSNSSAVKVLEKCSSKNPFNIYQLNW